MQISHVLAKEFNPERFDTQLSFGLWLFSIVFRLVLGNPNHTIGLIAAILCGLDCFRFAIIVALRMARLLKINVLFWTPPKQK